MKRIRTSDLLPGMITAEDVYSYNNQMILPKDTKLTDKMITRLEFYSILAIRVNDEDDTDASNEQFSSETPEETSYSQKVKASKQFKEFEKSFLNSTETFKNNLDALVTASAPAEPAKLYQMITDLVPPDMTSVSVFDMLHNMRQYDDFTYMHSINVALICNVFAKWIHLPKKETEILTLAGLLHDVGKLLVPDKIIRKPERLTPSEYNIIKTHALQGYNVLKGQNLDVNVKETALMHHERCDGSGYPLGLTGDKINSYAKIVSIADVYDAMTAARIYRGPLCPFKVISIFENEGLQKYDSKYILTFLEHVAATYMNNRVRLSNGMEGNVVFMNKNNLSRPMIQCGKQFIDLSREPNLYIETFV